MWRPDRRLTLTLSLASLLTAGVAAPGRAAPAAAATNPAATPAAPAPASAASVAPPSAAGGDAFKDRLTALPAAADLRPKGPVEITADRTDAVEGMTAIYSGHVNLVSDTLHLDGDRLELKQHADHAFEARVTGSPAHMSHAGTGPENPPMAAHARTLNYDSSSGIVDLVGEAFVDRNGDTTTADTIRYSLVDRSLQANGGKQQVHIVIQPPPGTPGADSPPAASAGGGSAATTAPAPAAAATAPAPAPSSAPAQPATPAASGAAKKPAAAKAKPHR